jgi:hypothetical protein
VALTPVFIGLHVVRGRTRCATLATQVKRRVTRRPCGIKLEPISPGTGIAGDSNDRAATIQTTSHVKVAPPFRQFGYYENVKPLKAAVAPYTTGLPPPS